MNKVFKVMGGSLIALLIVMLSLWAAVPELIADVTFRQPWKSGLTVGDIPYAIDGSGMGKLTAGTASYALLSNGSAKAPIYGDVGVAEAAGEYVFLPAAENCNSFNTTSATQPLIASVSSTNGDWFLTRGQTGQAETERVYCRIGDFLSRIGGTKGVKITQVDVVHHVQVSTLSSATINTIATRGFTNNVSATGAVGSMLATRAAWPLAANTMSTAAGVGPYIDSLTMITPAYLPLAANQDIVSDMSVTVAAGGLWKFYGIGVTFTRKDH